MRILHILKTKPDPTVEKLCHGLSKKAPSSVIPLYEGRVDWLSLVDEIFSHDKIICWW